MGKPLKLKLKVNGGYIAKETLKRAVYDTYIDGVLDVVSELQRQSYEGATGELKAGWDFSAPRKEVVGTMVAVNIYNHADHAFNRIVGSPPNTIVPLPPLTDWVQMKIEPDYKKARRIAFLIGRKIARVGTDRWQSGENFAGLNKDGTIKQGSLLDKAQSTIANKIFSQVRGIKKK